MICKRCQAELPEGQRFCPTCGALQPMICPACGAESRAGSRTCSACGKKLPMADREDKLVYTRRKKRTGSVAAAVAVVLGALLILGAAAMFLFSTLEEIGKDEPVSMQQETKPEQVPEEPEITPEETESEETTQPEKTEPEETTQPEEESEEETEEEIVAADPLPGEKVADSQWFFEDSNSRLLTEADIADLTAEELQLARNEIYARHGRRFNSAALQAHFDSCSWYRGTIAPEAFDEGVFNDVELANIAFLKAAE